MKVMYSSDRGSGTRVLYGMLARDMVLKAQETYRMVLMLRLLIKSKFLLVG
jgi:hypothetical protein